jgi:hypothetical protein
MLKGRLKQAGLPTHYSQNSFSATGITNYLENDGTLEAAQRIAGHAESWTTKLCDGRGQKICSRTWGGCDTDAISLFPISRIQESPESFTVDVMSFLKAIDRRSLETFLEMSSGYVLNSSDYTFGDLVRPSWP